MKRRTKNITLAQALDRIYEGEAASRPMACVLMVTEGSMMHHRCIELQEKGLAVRGKVSIYYLSTRGEEKAARARRESP